MKRKYEMISAAEFHAIRSMMSSLGYEEIVTPEQGMGECSHAFEKEGFVTYTLHSADWDGKDAGWFYLVLKENV